MNGLPYYKAYPRDFVEGTIGMPFEIKCAYRVVIDLIYMQGGDLPDDARYISGHLGCSIRKWSAIRAALIEMGKLQVSGGFLTNYRADKELETLAKLQDKMSENARQPRKNKGLEKPLPSHTEPEPEPEPEPERDTNVSLMVVKADPDGFDEFWQEVPRKAGKGAARKAYAQAIKKADPQTLIAAIQRYAEERRGKDEKYTAHPATWLNAERWLDAPPKAGASDFHDQLSKALGGDNGLPAAIADHHDQTQHVPARIPAPRTPDDRTGVAGDTQIGGRGEQAYRRLNRG
jgi:uncharacterized protein YdaU (DUF1376 family)